MNWKYMLKSWKLPQNKVIPWGQTKFGLQHILQLDKDYTQIFYQFCG